MSGMHEGRCRLVLKSEPLSSDKINTCRPHAGIHDWPFFSNPACSQAVGCGYCKNGILMAAGQFEEACKSNLACCADFAMHAYLVTL